MRSLITGGAGFIGSHVALHCLRLGHEVVIMDDLSGGFRENVPEGVYFVKGSVTDHQALEALFEEWRFDYVYHLAAYAAEGLSHFIRRFNYMNNLVGTVNLINEAVKHQVKCFVFTSSIAVYGDGQMPASEEDIPQPEDPYGVSKYAAELDLRSAQRLFGLECVIFRPHNVYGPGQNIGDHYRNVVGIFMNRIMQGRPMPIFGNGLQTRAFTYIDDVAPYIAKCVNVPQARNLVFNIGADTPHTVLDLARVVARACGAEANIEFLPARQEVIHAFSKHHKVQKVLASAARVQLEEGIQKMAKWAGLHGARTSAPFAQIEISKNMPPSWAKLASKRKARGADQDL
jgi:UDP-glucose 4-epimerase